MTEMLRMITGVEQMCVQTGNECIDSDSSSTMSSIKPRGKEPKIHPIHTQVHYCKLLSANKHTYTHTSSNTAGWINSSLPSFLFPLFFFCRFFFFCIWLLRIQLYCLCVCVFPMQIMIDIVCSRTCISCLTFTCTQTER